MILSKKKLNQRLIMTYDQAYILNLLETIASKALFRLQTQSEAFLDLLYMKTDFCRQFGSTAQAAFNSLLEMVERMSVAEFVAAVDTVIYTASHQQ